MLIILPYGLGVSRDCRWSANRREVMNAGRRFMDNILSKSSTLVSVMDENWLIPALLMMISISPHSSMIFCKQSSKAVLSLTSTGKNWVPVCNAVSFPDASFLSQNATRWPAPLNVLTMAFPIPSAPPVMKTLLVLWSVFVLWLVLVPEVFRAWYCSYFFSK